MLLWNYLNRKYEFLFFCFCERRIDDSKGKKKERKKEQPQINGDVEKIYRMSPLFFEK